MESSNEVEALRRELKEATDHAQRLEEGLRPFVTFADTLPPTQAGVRNVPDGEVLLRRTSLNTGEERILTAGDFRTAYVLQNNWGIDFRAKLKRDVVRKTIAEVRRLADGSTFRVNGEVEWRIIDAVLNSEEA